MKGIFSYDSKLMRILDSIANTMILNAMFLIFSLPIVTIGASTTALFSGCRAMVKKEPCFRAFWQTFYKSFKRSTLAWVILLPMIVLSAFTTFSLMYVQMEGYEFPLVMAAIGLIFLLELSNMVFLFYSRFECTLLQLIKNGILLTISHPLQSIIIGVLFWGPVMLFFFNPALFLQMTMVWLIMYFSTSATVAVWLMNKPFRKLAISVLGEEEVERRLQKERERLADEWQ